MTDLRDQLSALAGPTAPPTVAVADADLARGRRALRRRRTAQALGGAGFTVAALVAAFTFTTGINAGEAGPAAQDRPAAASAVQLVSYKGKQPKGFTLDKVPDGWFVQADDQTSIILAPSAIKGKRGADPSTDPRYDKQSFVGKIGVFLQSRDQDGPPPGTAVKVGDRDGVLVNDQGAADGQTLWVQQPSGIYLLIQFWDHIGLDQDQKIDFGSGVHVTKGAKQTSG